MDDDEKAVTAKLRRLIESVQDKNSVQGASNPELFVSKLERLVQYIETTIASLDEPRLAQAKAYSAFEREPIVNRNERIEVLKKIYRKSVQLFRGSDDFQVGMNALKMWVTQPARYAAGTWVWGPGNRPYGFSVKCNLFVYDVINESSILRPPKQLNTSSPLPAALTCSSKSSSMPWCPGIDQGTMLRHAVRSGMVSGFV